MHPLLGLSLHPALPPGCFLSLSELNKFPCSHGLALKVLSREAGWKMVSVKRSINWSEKNTWQWSTKIKSISNPLYVFLSWQWRQPRRRRAGVELSGQLKTRGLILKWKLLFGLFWMVKLELCSWKWCCWWTGRCLWSITAVGLFIKRRGGDDQSRCNYSFRSRAYSMAYWKAGRHRAAGGRRKKQQGVKQIF